MVFILGVHPTSLKFDTGRDFSNLISHNTITKLTNIIFLGTKIQTFVYSNGSNNMYFVTDLEWGKNAVLKVLFLVA